MPEYKTYIAREEDAGKRLDQFLSNQLPNQSRAAIQKWLGEGLVQINGQRLAKNYRIKGDEQILLAVPDPIPLDVRPEPILLDVLYEDQDLLVVNKPKGMVVHPAPGHAAGTLVNALLYHCQGSLSGINGVMRPGIVHRIDKDTSGLLVVAKNDQAHLHLARQIQQHSFTRCYQAVAYGRFGEEHGSIDQPIGRSERDRKKMCVTAKNSRRAVTHYELLENFDQFAHLQLRLETGRTHQIRVHLAFIGHPIAGDPVYGPKKCLTYLQGQCLHAKTIGFIHPRTNEYLAFDSELPAYFQNFLMKLRR